MVKNGPNSAYWAVLTEIKLRVKRYRCGRHQNCILISTHSSDILKLGCAEIPYPCTVAARYFAHLSVVSSRQHSNDVLWLRCRVIILLLIALLWTWMSCMKVTLKGFGFVKSIEVDGGALMKAGIVVPGHS